MRLSVAVASLLVAWLAGLGCIQAVTLEVNEGNTTCIKAELSATFSITYNSSSSTRTVTVSLPNSTTVDADRSSCGADGSSPWLVAVFGTGHEMGMSFSTNSVMYSVANLTLQYNLSDASVFPEANRSDVVTVVVPSVGIWATMNTTYRCMSPSTFVGEAAVTFSDMRLEAYMPGNDLSPTESVCTADQTSTTAPPTTAGTTTTAAPAPTPPGTPERGTYSVNNLNGTVCLLAQMALQLNVSYFSPSQNKTVRELVNLTPNLTRSSGSCEAGSASLVLAQEGSSTLNFTFTLNSTSNKYHLSGIALLANLSDAAAPFSAGNASLDYLRSTLGRSYICNAEQTLVVVTTFSLNTFRLQVQPFEVTTNQFATAEECQTDQDKMLIPIVVGAALAGLVLIVLIAYLIGRRRSHAGYQTI
ncbi:lysosome-associated membrane glycoprotein 1a [Pseudoliparis swirei]|uniref:lysosome-associated membrane glycoprotein 1a n=1 Tax=Pseudoliparis swirei TaxID=2059687 RepID=UPI0024BE0C5E|nr:lysosome-associated membrane glycoprotein 1a [Pseudoliparis swirei]